jgi:hypothetical protein
VTSVPVRGRHASVILLGAANLYLDLQEQRLAPSDYPNSVFRLLTEA